LTYFLNLINVFINFNNQALNSSSLLEFYISGNKKAFPTKLSTVNLKIGAQKDNKLYTTKDNSIARHAALKFKNSTFQRAILNFK
jgi:hypothetical protein